MVGPRASELIHPVSIAVAESLTADQLAQAFTVYPSISGSVAEAALVCTASERFRSGPVVRPASGTVRTAAPERSASTAVASERGVAGGSPDVGLEHHVLGDAVTARVPRRRPSRPRSAWAAYHGT